MRQDAASTLMRHPAASALLLFLPFALQTGVVVLEELADVVGKSEQALPLLDVQCHRHALQAVHADASLFTDFAIERAPLGLLDFRQEFGGFFDAELPGREF